MPRQPDRLLLTGLVHGIFKGDVTIAAPENKVV
jgi:hypothetical protein